MQSFKCNTIVDLYKFAANQLLNNPEQIRSPRGQKIHEIVNANIQIDTPMQCIWNEDCDSRPYPIQYLKDELKLYLTCDDSLESFSKISKFWSKLSDDDMTVNSAYGKIVYYETFSNKKQENFYTQFDWVINSFKKDRDTRQAIMFIASPYYQYEGNKDFICTLNYHFIINNQNQLDLIVNRRSQDLHFGLPFDVSWEVVLQNIILFEINKFYPEVTLGKYYLNCNSLHIYERNFPIFEKIITDNTMTVKSLPKITNNYFMNDAILHNINNQYVAHLDNDEFLNWLLK